MLRLPRSGARPTRRVLLGERHVVAVRRCAARRAAPRRTASARAGRAPRARPAAARPRGGRARSPPRRGCGGAPRCRPDRTSLPRRRRRSPPARHRGARAGRRAPARETARRPARILFFARDEALAHGGGRDQEGRRDGRGVEAQNGLQDQRRADAGVDRRMRAGEHQRKALVGNVVRHAAASSSSRHQAHLIRARLRRCAAGAPHRSPCGARRRAARLPGFAGCRSPASRRARPRRRRTSASSAAATSRVRADRYATSLP